EDGQFREMILGLGGRPRVARVRDLSGRRSLPDNAPRRDGRGSRVKGRAQPDHAVTRAQRAPLTREKPPNTIPRDPPGWRRQSPHAPRTGAPSRPSDQIAAVSCRALKTRAYALTKPTL